MSGKVGPYFIYRQVEKIGEANGHEVMYDANRDLVYCKRFRCPAQKLIDAFQSQYDREPLEGDLVMKKFDNEVTLGCLNLTIKDSKQLIKQIKDARINTKA